MPALTENLQLPHFDLQGLTAVRQDAQLKWQATPLLTSLRNNQALFQRDEKLWTGESKAISQNTTVVKYREITGGKWNRITADFIIALERRVGRALNGRELDELIKGAPTSELVKADILIRDLATRARLSLKNQTGKDHNPQGDIAVDIPLFVYVCLDRMKIADKNPDPRAQQATRKIAGIEKPQTATATGEKKKPTKTEKVKAVEFKGTRIYLVVGDISDPHPVDAIVAPAYPTFTEGADHTWHRIKDKSGTATDLFQKALNWANADAISGRVQKVWHKRHRPGQNITFQGMPVGYTAVTEAGNIPNVKQILHTSYFFDAQNLAQNPAEGPQNLRAFAYGALTRAGTNMLTSVALPVVGLGAQKMGLPTVLSAMAEGIELWKSKNPGSSVREITLYMSPHAGRDSLQDQLANVVNTFRPVAARMSAKKA